MESINKFIKTKAEVNLLIHACSKMHTATTISLSQENLSVKVGISLNWVTQLSIMDVRTTRSRRVTFMVYGGLGVSHAQTKMEGNVCQSQKIDLIQVFSIIL